MSRTDMTKAQWAALEPLLQSNPRRGQLYNPVNGILWRLETGAPWQDVPHRYGPWQTCYDGFVRWSRDGTWLKLLQTLQAHADQDELINWEGAALDSTHIRAQRSATGARKTPAKAEKRGSLKANGRGATLRTTRWARSQSWGTHQQNPCFERRPSPSARGCGL